MSLPPIVKREIEVALSKHSQPVWFRLVKYIVILACVYLFWDSPWFWIIFFILTLISLVLHFWYRHKTQGWTKSYGIWKHFESKYDLKEHGENFGNN